MIGRMFSVRLQLGLAGTDGPGERTSGLLEGVDICIHAAGGSGAKRAGRVPADPSWDALGL